MEKKRFKRKLGVALVAATLLTTSGMTALAAASKVPDDVKNANPEDRQIMRPYIKGHETVGTTLSGEYVYYDVCGNHQESGTTFQWYRSDEKNGTYQAIAGATEKNYTLTEADVGAYLKFGVASDGCKDSSSWMIGPVQSSNDVARIMNYFDNSNDYMYNVNVIQAELAERMADAVYFTVDSTGEVNDGMLVGSEYLYQNNQKQAFEDDTIPVVEDGVVYAPAAFFTTYLGVDAPDVAINRNGYYDLKAAAAALGKAYWSGDENQSDVASFEMSHLGQGLIVIGGAENIFDPVRDRDLINEACNQLYTLRATDEQMQWFRDAKYGMFLHWDPSSLSGVEISWDRAALRPGEVQNAGNTALDMPYDTLYKQFNPTKYNPKEWMELAKEAGMKYVVLTTKHHGGFSNFFTNYDNYTIAQAPYGKDIVKEYVDAAREAGLKIGFYYSARDWYNPNYMTEDHYRYLEYYFGQIQELLTQYGQIDIMWFDSIGMGENNVLNKWDARTLLRRMKQLQPNIIVNNRYTAVLADYESSPYDINGDWYTPEHRLGGFDSSRPWESCMTVTEAPGGGWSYRPDGRIKTVEESVKYLINNVINDGNLLYNIGPMPSGELKTEHADVFREVGKWLEPYGEAVYGTRGGPYINQKWGGSTYYTNKDGTQTIFLHVTPLLNNVTPEGNSLQLDFPTNGQFYESAELVKSGEEVILEQNEEGYLLTLPEGMEWDKWDTVIRMNVDLRTTLESKIQEAKKYAEELTAENLNSVKESLQKAIESAESVGNVAEMSEQMKLLSDALERARSAKALSDIIISTEEKLVLVAVGDNLWECPQILYDQLQNKVKEGEKLLLDGVSGKDAFEQTKSSLEVALGSLDDIMNKQVIIFSPENGNLEVGRTFTMKSPYEELQIRYTLDGSEPTVDSALYNGEPLKITGTASFVRAILVDAENRQVGAVQNHTYLAAGSLENIAKQKSSVTVSSIYSEEYGGEKAVDGSMSSRWATPDGTITATLELEFDEEKTVNAAFLQEYLDEGETTRISSYVIEYWDNETGSWKQAYKGGEGGKAQACVFESVTSNRFRLNIPSCMNVTIWEFGLYQAEVGTEVSKDAMNLALGKNASASSVYGDEFEASKATDGNDRTRWSAKDNTGEKILEVDLGEKTEVNQVTFDVYADKADAVNYEVYSSFKIQYEQDGEWVDAYDSILGTHKITYPVFNGSEEYGQDDPVWVDSNGVVKSTNYVVDFDTIQAQKIRLYSDDTKKEPSIIEFGAYKREREETRPELEGNLALNRPAAASSMYNANYPAELATDGNNHTRWASKPEQKEYWLEVELEEETIFDTVCFDVYADRLDVENAEIYQTFKIQYWDGKQWIDAYDSAENTHKIWYPNYADAWTWREPVYVGDDGSVKSTDYLVEFSPVKATKVRLYSDNTLKDPSLIELGVYRQTTEEPEVPTLPEITSVSSLTDIYVTEGTEFENLQLPMNVTATLDNGETKELPVVWSADGYKPTVPGTYTLTGTLTLDETLLNTAGHTATVKVIVETQLPDVNKTALATYLKRAQELVDDGTVATLIESVQKEFKQAIQEGAILMNDDEALQTDVDVAAQALYEVLGKTNLVAGDKELLKEMIKKAQDYIDNAGSDYSEDNVKALKKAVETAQETVDNKDALQADVDSAVTVLQKEINTFELAKKDWAGLEAMLKNATETVLPDIKAGVYVEDDAVDVYKALYEKADKMMKEHTASTEEILNMMDELDKAEKALKKKAEKTALKDALEQLKALDGSKFTEEEQAAVEKAILAAETLLNDETISEDKQNTVDATTQVILDLIETLKNGGEPKPEPTPEPDPTDPSNPSTDKGNGGNETGNGTDKTKDDNTDVPKTGDDLRGIIPIVMMMLAAITVVFVVKRRSC